MMQFDITVSQHPWVWHEKDVILFLINNEVIKVIVYSNIVNDKHYPVSILIIFTDKSSSSDNNYKCI